MRYEACATCIWWNRISSKLGMCHRGIPEPYRLQEDESRGDIIFGPTVDWPATKADDRCRGYEARPGGRR
jgi:hypothetical protein